MIRKKMELHDMMNIGYRLENDLKAVGILTPEDLRVVGSIGAFEKMAQAGVRNLTLRRLAALEGAIENVKKFNIDDKKRDEIEQYYFRFERDSGKQFQLFQK